MRKRPNRERVVQSLIDPPTYERLRKAAAAEDVSVSCYVRRLIERAITNQNANRVGNVTANKVAA